MDKCSTHKVPQDAATVVETRGGMITGIDKLHNILNGREEEIEVTLAAEKARTNP